MTRLATRLLQIIHFYLQLPIPTIAVKSSVLCSFHVGFTSRSQELNRKGSDQKMKVCTVSCHFISVGENLLSASIMLQFSLALLGRGDNSRLFFFRQKAGLYSLLTRCKCPFFSCFGQRKAGGLVTQRIQQRLQILSAHNDKTYP